MARNVNAVWIILLLSGATLADAPDFNSIPQGSPQLRDKIRKEKLAYNRSKTLDLYEKFGDKNPRWNDDARKCLEHYAMLLVHPQQKFELELCWKYATMAVESGCTDPLVKYMEVRYSLQNDAKLGGPAKFSAAMEKIAKAMAASHYSPAHKARSLLYSRVNIVEPANSASRAAFSSIIDKCIEYLHEVATGPQPYDQAAAYNLARDLLSPYAKISTDRKVVYDRISKALEAAVPSKRPGLAFKGYFYIDYAWDARGSGPASSVTAQGQKDFAERLNIAQKALEQAWDLSPHEPDPLSGIIADRMMTVELGQGIGRERMELWFQRAMKADPDNAAACTTKMNYLEPKWYGSNQLMYSFGNACFSTNNWDADLPFLLLNACDRIAAHLDEQTKSSFYKTPQIARRIKATITAHLKHYPEDHFTRTAFISYLLKTGDVLEARRQFDRLGDNYSRRAMSPASHLATRQALEKLERESKKTDTR